MHRAVGVVCITLIVLVGALHYPPLWAFVLVVPVWALWFLHAEEQRIREDAWLRLREWLERDEAEE